MGQFLKFVFASCLGVFLAMLLLIFVGAGVAGSAASTFGKKKVSVKPNSLLEINFNDPIPERTNNVPMDPYSFENEEIYGVHEIVKAIEKAKEDDNIKGIFLDASSASGGFATRSLIREALIDFKESGKFITAYSEGYTQSGYYMASVADEVYVHPLGGSNSIGGPIDFRGFGVQIPFYKDALDKLGVKMNVYYVGKFKSATEPFRRNNMSPESRKQIKEYLEPIYEVYLKDISATRGVSIGELKNIANNWLVQTPEDAITYKLADKIGYRDEVMTALKERIGLEEEDKLKTLKLEDYVPTARSLDLSIKDKIAVIYAEGQIMPGEETPGEVRGDQYPKMVEKIRKNDKVKAIVLRVDSPGGSALVSENIWRELSLAQRDGKPVVASFGDVAASGGYYIACMADRIYAQPNSITGSIGIFGMIPNANKLMKDKLGISIDTVNTGRFASSINLFHDQTPEEAAIIQKSLNSGYETFLKRVADGRKMTRDEVHQVAQGRVWVGEKAKEIGLVDELGELKDAIAYAAELAEIDKYRVTEYPKIKDPFQQLIDKYLNPEKAKALILQEELGEIYPYYQEVQDIIHSKEPQARLPYRLDFE